MVGSVAADKYPQLTKTYCKIPYRFDIPAVSWEAVSNANSYDISEL